MTVNSKGLPKEAATQQPSGTKVRARALNCLLAASQKLVQGNGSASNTTGSAAIIKIKIDAPVVSMYVGSKVAEESILMATAKASCDKIAEVVRFPASHILRDLHCWIFVLMIFAFKLIRQQFQLIFLHPVRSCSVLKFSQDVHSCQRH